MLNAESIVTPNEIVPRRILLAIVCGWLVLWVAGWSIFRPAILPSPVEVIQSLPEMLFEDGLLAELVTSFTTNAEALAISIVVSLGFAYLSVVPAFRPLVDGISKLRFVSPAAFMFVLIIATSSGHQLKLSILTIGISVFFLTTMIGIVAAIPKERFDHARTLRMTEWQTVWYVIIRGTAEQAMDVIRDNAAMGWAMLTMVEGLVRSEGGVGVMILNENKYLNIANVYAIVLSIIVVGLLQDYALAKTKGLVVPHATLGLERK